MIRLKVTTVGNSAGVVLPKELLDACGIGEEATVIVQNRTLIVAAPHWRPRQGWDEALKGLDAAATGEDEETLVHWATLPEAPEPRKPAPDPNPEAVLGEESKPYGKPESRGGA